MGLLRQLPDDHDLRHDTETDIKEVFDRYAGAEHADTALLVASSKIGKSIVGSCAVNSEVGVATVDAAVVHPLHRRKGIYRVLSEASKTWAEPAPAERINSDDNTVLEEVGR